MASIFEKLKQKGLFIITVIPFIFSLLLSASCVGQTEVYRKWGRQYHLSLNPKTYGAVEKIDFLDTLNNKILNSVNVIELNPYYELSRRCKVLTDSTTTRIKLLYPKNYSEEKKIWKGKTTSDKPAYFILDRTSGGSGIPPIYAVFGYIKQIYNQSDSLLAIISSYYIYNNRGELVQAFKDMISSARPKFTIVSNNGQYMCISTIKMAGSDILQSLDFYDIKSKRHLDHIECPFVSHEVLPYPVLENKFMIELIFDGDSVWYQLFDVKNKTMQEERYHPDVYVKPERDGLKIVNPDRSTFYKRYIDFQFIKTDKR